jgi:TolB-like protein
MFRKFAFVLISLLVTSAAWADEKPRLVVLPLQAKGIPTETVAVIDDLFFSAIFKTEKFQVISPNDISNLLGAEKMKEAVSCDNLACAPEIGGALGARYLLAGSVGKLGDAMIITVKVIDTEKPAVIKIENAKVKDENNWPVNIQLLTEKLLTIESLKIENPIIEKNCKNLIHPYIALSGGGGINLTTGMLRRGGIGEVLLGLGYEHDFLLSKNNRHHFLFASEASFGFLRLVSGRSPDSTNERDMKDDNKFLGGLMLKLGYRYKGFTMYGTGEFIYQPGLGGGGGLEFAYYLDKGCSIFINALGRYLKTNAPAGRAIMSGVMLTPQPAELIFRGLDLGFGLRYTFQ